jgi:hypothetical protein
MTMRILTAAGVLVSAFVHLWLWIDGFRHIHVIGPAFMVNASAGIVITILLLRWNSWIPLFLAVGFGASTLGAFILSTTVGLFGTNEVWSGGWVMAAALSEVVAILAGLVALRQEVPRHSRV